MPVNGLRVGLIVRERAPKAAHCCAKNVRSAAKASFVALVLPVGAGVNHSFGICRLPWGLKLGKFPKLRFEKIARGDGRESLPLFGGRFVASCQPLEVRARRRHRRLRIRESGHLASRRRAALVPHISPILAKACAGSGSANEAHFTAPKREARLRR